MNTVIAFISGLLFGLGLLISGLGNPAKVLGFLDLAGTWDPSLAFVMIGAIAVGLVAFTLAKRRVRSWLGQPMQLPTANQIDRRLIGGGLLFGIGWGIAGICPGPSFVLVGAGEIKGVVFLIAMLAGMALYEGLERSKQRLSGELAR